MIIKVQTQAHQDRFLVEAAFINWEYLEGEAYVILEIHLKEVRTEKAGDMFVQDETVSDEPSLRMKVYDGDRVFIMNDAGKTIDSKTIAIGKESRRAARGYETETCKGCLYIKAEHCVKHDKKIYSLCSRRCSLWEWKGPS